jgi:nitroreductase
MEAMEAILTRRSIRHFTGQPVETETVHELLEAAMSAPSAGNEQPWQFVVVTGRQLLNEIPKHHPYSSMLPGAALAILVCGDLKREKHPGFWVQDCAAATQNILLAAHARGLGAVWLGIHPRQKRAEAIGRLFGLPGGVVPLCLIAIGHPAEEKPPPNRYDLTRIHYNKW